MDAFKAICKRFIAKTQKEPGCLYYGFSFNGDHAHCREGYVNAQALLDHSANVADIFQEALQLVELTRVEIHGPAQELDKLREHFAELNVDYYTLEQGFRRN